MKTLLPFIVALALNSVAPIQTSYAGSEGGGGGDETERRFHEVRADLLKWVQAGGAKSLNLPAGVDAQDYSEKMKSILAPQKVVVGFVENDNQTDPELQVSVDGVPKTCRGFYAQKDDRPHVICHIGRFNNTSEAGQYRLVHHEFAGLVMLERNSGAASDYEISNQITNYLREEKILRLAIVQEQDRIIRPCGLYGKLNDRIKDCNGGPRYSQFEEVMNEIFQYDLRQVNWVKVMEAKDGAVVVLNSLTQKLWARNLSEAKMDYYTAQETCKKLDMLGVKWSLPKKSDFLDNDNGLMWYGRPDRGSFIWTQSEVEHGRLWGLVEGDWNNFFSVFDPRNRMGEVRCVAKKRNLFD